MYGRSAAHDIKELRSSHKDSIDNHQIEIENNHINPKNAKATKQTKRTDKKAPEGTVSIRSAKEFVLKPETLTAVTIRDPFVQQETEGYLEGCMNIHINDRNLWRTSDCLISKNSLYVRVANFSDKQISIPEGHLLGYMR